MTYIFTLVIIFLFDLLCNWISYESGILENPDQEAPETLYQMTTAPETSPNDPTVLEITFDKGFLLLTHKKLMCWRLWMLGFR